MLRFFTPHSERYEVPSATLAAVGPDPGRLDQSRTTGRCREHLLAENRILRKKLGKKRILLNDGQRRRLAKGKILGRKMLAQLATIVSPNTILRIGGTSASPLFKACQYSIIAH
jgi:hypothetical protein